ncbi:hypothetical protein EH240_36045 [Mesorhizobium tamadayense]|uniref:PIN domain-containing protein n=1 Tax=Mesorhizobium tamadayense TaxID=425306 RepID=A0A3P3EN95_9HYPH|nr:hypothetical protein EH240_36045 [Mesorhizobium tamadayense]
MRVLVSHTSVIIDLERGNLLEHIFRLPFEFAVPDLLFHRELKGPTGDGLVARGLRIEELSSHEVTRATTVQRRNPTLSFADAFAFSLAEMRGWLLLTGDGGLRRLAVAERLEVHGVLWLLDQMEAGRHLSSVELHVCLSAIASHPRSRLPVPEVRRRLARYR